MDWLCRLARKILGWMIRDQKEGVFLADFRNEGATYIQFVAEIKGLHRTPSSPNHRFLFIEHGRGERF